MAEEAITATGSLQPEPATEIGIRRSKTAVGQKVGQNSEILENLQA
jgi:hypothetical protein